MNEDKMEIVEQKAGAVSAAPSNSVTPAELLRYALDSGADLDRLEKLMDLQMRYEADLARKAFADDMTRFKAKPLEILKDKRVGFDTDRGRTEYMHATIGNVVDVIVPALAEFGFSHRWDLDQRDGLVVVTCVITHRMGHKQETTLMANPDQSGKKNAIQSVISAKTYLERHTLLAATGLATKDQPDDDGAEALTAAERGAVGEAVRESRAKSDKKSPAASLLCKARMAADNGRDEFAKFWKECTPAQRGDLRNDIADLEQRVAKREANGGSAK